MLPSYSQNMIKEQSFGIIPLQKRQGEWFVLVVMLLSGKHWSLPKGHANKGETPQQTAERELQEETGLHILEWLPYGPYEETYFFKRDSALVGKTVVYFPAIVEGNVVTQKEEIEDYQWVPIAELAGKMTYKPAKTVADDFYKAFMTQFQN